MSKDTIMVTCPDCGGWVLLCAVERQYDENPYEIAAEIRGQVLYVDSEDVRSGKHAVCPSTCARREQAALFEVPA